MQRLDIDVRVLLDSTTPPEKRLEFLEGVMAVFRACFPDAAPIIRPDAPSPVTVTFHESVLEDWKPDPNSNQIVLPSHEDIVKGMEEDATD